MTEEREYRRLNADGTPNLLTQEEVEARMFHGGVKRAETMMITAEDNGRADTNPYAKEVFRDFVTPIADALRGAFKAKRATMSGSHLALISSLDPDAIAYLSVRSALTQLLNGTERPQHRAVAYEIGKTIHSELVLSQIEESAPELYHTLVNDFNRRLSKSERHRMTVFKMQAVKRGITVVEWPRVSRDAIGCYLLGLMEVAGLVDIEPIPRQKAGKQPPRGVTLSMPVMERIDSIKSYIAITMPVYGPCVVPPRDWTTPSDGGFYTRELIRTHPLLVRCHSGARHLYREADMPIVLAAANALQRTAWRVNARMLDTVLALASRQVTTEEIVGVESIPFPDKPAWLQPGGDVESMTAEQQDAFKVWKRGMAECYTQRKLQGTKYGRFYSATRAADMFRDYPEVYFVFFADSRGRMYPMTYGLNPQGSDLQRALLQFADGLPVETPEAVRWFLVHGANKFGFDKATLEERAAWVTERQQLLLDYADNPVSNRGWLEASDPMQFLAWCFEYAAWVRDDRGAFVSHLPISMDGSCNGLQNLSAMFRDEVGGKATNLTANDRMEDIYNHVAQAAMVRLKETKYDDPAKDRLRLMWIEHGVNRKVVKRSVMTTPYGVTRTAAVKYVVTDYLEVVDNPFDRYERRQAAEVLMLAVWPAIGDVVVKGRQAMDWLRSSARIITKDLDQGEDSIISWTSPSGFPAAQSYYEPEVLRVITRLAGVAQIRVMAETDEVAVNKHANGLAPNFVHSMDAAHLHLTTNAAAALGIRSLAMIHDDYGTHAAKSGELARMIREQFVSMYANHDPIEALRLKYPKLKPPPERGTLDIDEVLASRYFFS